jgi:type IV pilus assembly protein PilO
MRDQSEIWRQRLWIWLPALLFFLANATAFTIYRMGYAGQVQSLEANLEEVDKQLAPQTQKSRVLEQRLQKAKTTEVAVRKLYDDVFATRSERLTKVTTEVRSLARKAGLNPRTITYPQERIEDYGLIKRSWVFSVDGTYVELRQFLNLLELTDSFLTLEAITLSEETSDEGPELRMSLTISTLFAEEPGSAESAVLARRRTES